MSDTISKKVWSCSFCEVVFGHPHELVQPATQTLRAPVQQALQVTGGGRCQLRLFAGGVQVGASESGEGQFKTSPAEQPLQESRHFLILPEETDHH